MLLSKYSYGAVIPVNTPLHRWLFTIFIIITNYLFKVPRKLKLTRDYNYWVL